MCACGRQPAFSACLKPPEGKPLVLNEGATWIGRGSFPASTKALLLCSRKQACFQLTAVLEYHGMNPLLFVVCHSRNFHGTQETPASELLPLQKGEAVELTDGDQFYYAALECLLTVAIKQNFARDALQRASNASLAEEHMDVEITGELRCSVDECGTSEPQNLCASSSKIVPASHPPVVESLFASKPLFLEKPRGRHGGVQASLSIPRGGAPRMFTCESGELLWRQMHTVITRRLNHSSCSFQSNNFRGLRAQTPEDKQEIPKSSIY